MAVKFCGNCGTRLPMDAAACPNCAWSVPQTASFFSEPEAATVPEASAPAAADAPTDAAHPTQKADAVSLPRKQDEMTAQRGFVINPWFDMEPPERVDKVSAQNGLCVCSVADQKKIPSESSKAPSAEIPAADSFFSNSDASVCPPASPAPTVPELPDGARKPPQPVPDSCSAGFIPAPTVPSKSEKARSSPGLTVLGIFLLCIPVLGLVFACMGAYGGSFTSRCRRFSKVRVVLSSAILAAALLATILGGWTLQSRGDFPDPITQTAVQFSELLQ